MKTVGKIFARASSKKRGMILILTLIFITLGSLLLPPLLSYMATASKHTTVFQQKTERLYAADSGVIDAKWKIKYDQLSGYSPYDFTGPAYNYALNSEISQEVNDYPVNVSINNVWIPKNVPTPGQVQAANIIQAGKLMVTDSVIGSSTQQIKITYYKGGTDSPLQVETLGVWLPPGFNYVAGSSNLESDHSAPYYPSSVTAGDWDGGQAIIWTFKANTLFAGSAGPQPVAAFPGVDRAKIPMTSAITFQFTSQQSGAIPNAVSWITTAGVSDIPFSWDADNKIYHINSVAGGTQIDTYTAKNELRNLGSAVNGDYRAVGNSLMVMGPGNNQNNDPHGIRYALLSHSSADVNDIPSDSSVVGAYLYWSGWLQNSNETLGNSYGTKVNFNINGNQVSFDNNGNPQRGGQAITSSKNQTYPNHSTQNGDYSYSCYKDVTALVQWELKQERPIDLNFPGNASYDVGPATGVTLGDTGNDWSYAGWSLVIIYTGASTQGHQIYLYDKFTYADHQTDIDPTGNTAGPGGTIGGFLVPNKITGVTGITLTNQGTGYTSAPSVTITGGGGTGAAGSAMVSGGKVSGFTLTNPGTGYTSVPSVSITGGGGSGAAATALIEVDAAQITAFVGEGDWCWAGDFIAFNAPAQYWSNPWNIPDPTPSQPWKLWDGITLDASHVATSPYLPNNAAHPNNVWNGYSQTGLNDGVDIKTFHITWASGLLQPGDTSARLDMPTYTDVWNLVYIVFSFRSATTTGGNLGYLIH
jgi:hypothetical protein